MFVNSHNEIIDKSDIINEISNYDEIIVKPSIQSGGGRNITFIKKNKYNEIMKILENYGTNYLIQEVIQQYEELSKFNKSINTIRIMSFWYKGEIIILSSVLRMGINNNRTDNATNSGISCGISKDGYLKEVGYDLSGKRYDKHPNGKRFKGVKIPNYDKIISIINNKHREFGHFRIISWDFALDKNAEPYLIEFNLGCQGINILQLNNGPLFGNLTSEVLDSIFLGGTK